MKILSCGAGMQSSALHLMSCENALAKIRGEPPVWPQVPIYDISIFCDLGFEPPWVKKQVEFLANAGHSCGVPLVILDSPLYTDFMENFGERRTISIPWWTIKEDGHKSKMPRNCTIDYKVELISKYVRWELLGYKRGSGSGRKTRRPTRCTWASARRSHAGVRRAPTPCSSTSSPWWRWV